MYISNKEDVKTFGSFIVSSKLYRIMLKRCSGLHVAEHIRVNVVYISAVDVGREEA